MVLCARMGFREARRESSSTAVGHLRLSFFLCYAGGLEDFVGALTIGFDTTIVGALALPWVILIVHLFFLSRESSIEVLFRWIRRLNQPAVVSVLLFAVAYTLGSAVSRIAQDFFNDNDLHLELDGHPLRDGITENPILTSVYCDSNEANLLSVRP
jgi:hypothetical protein